MNTQKTGGFVVILLGVPLGIIAPDRMLLATAASIGLMMIFFAKERIDDERVQQLKMKAMFAAMSSGIMFTFLAHHYASRVLAGGWGDANASIPAMSVWEFLAGILLIALGLFHYWRWQDARPVREG